MQNENKSSIPELNGTKSTLHDWLQSKVIVLICLVFLGFFPYTQLKNNSLKSISKNFQHYIFEYICILDQ